MKFVIAIVLFFALKYTISQEEGFTVVDEVTTEEAELTKDNAIKRFFEIAKFCLAQIGAPIDVLTDFIAFKDPKGPKAECFPSCLMRMTNTLTDASQLDKAGLLKISQVYSNKDPKKIQIAKEIIDICIVIDNDYHCKLADQFISCVRQQALNRNVTFL